MEVNISEEIFKSIIVSSIGSLYIIWWLSNIELEQEKTDSRVIRFVMELITELSEIVFIAITSLATVVALRLFKDDQASQIKYKTRDDDLTKYKTWDADLTKYKTWDADLIDTLSQELCESFPDEWDGWQHWICDIMEDRTRMQSKGVNLFLVSLITAYRLTHFVWHIGISKIFILSTRRTKR
jgi:hypothetical protein